MDDLHHLIRLKDALEGAQKNTEKILSRLQRFESHLTDLDDRLRPIEESTEGYIIAKQNISNTLLEVGKTFEYFKIATEVKDVISCGLSADTQRAYFEALGRLSNAKKFFESHREIKSSGTVLSTIDTYLTKAVSECVQQFEKLLQTCQKSVAIVDGRFEMLNPMTEDVAKDIKSICDVLELHKHSAHFKTYQTVRIAKLKAELKEVEQLSPTSWTHLLQDGPYEKGKYPFDEYFTLSYYLLRSENQLWASTLPNSEESLYVFINICESLINEVQAIVAPFLSEESGKSRSSTNIIIKQSQLLLIRLDILDTYLSQFDRMRDLCRLDMRRESKASALLLQIKRSIVHASLNSVVNLISSSYVESFSADKKTNSDTFNESLSCDLHPVTGNILHCCKEMMGWVGPVYKKMLELAVELQVDVLSVVPANQEVLMHLVIENLLNGLEGRAAKFDENSKARSEKRAMNVKAHGMHELEDKVAEDYILSARKHLFMANNLYSMYIFIKDRKRDQTSNESSMGVQLLNNDLRRASSMNANAMNANKPFSKNKQIMAIADKIELRLKQEQTSFCERIASVMGLTPTEMAEFQVLHEKDKSGHGRALKAKFTLFNTGMEALRAQQGEWRVSSTGLREHMSAQLQDTVLPVYTEFYNTYAAVKFSKKHMDRYLRFPPAEVEWNLKTFFGRS